MLSILRKARLKDKEMRILMLGLDNAGKTTIVKKIMGEDVNTVSPTLGFIIKTIDYDGYKLNIWDVGGQKTLRSYWRNYFEKTDALIWVVDATDRLRIEDCREELHGLLQEEVRANGEDGEDDDDTDYLEQVCSCLPTRPTSTDAWTSRKFFKLGAPGQPHLGPLLGGVELTYFIQGLQLEAIRTHRWHVLRCSAMTGSNLKEGLAWVVDDAKKRLFLY
ncbi:ADP-ribosylation factor 4 [Colletotrichum paranaense]|uniref:ADP-ribosylation factor 4 n=2 Tax=Colletotrichum acutatum species complex TaxID=2707335 RepID=A0AAI9UP89_9PEZI|nr:ADP-ribosylation factor 4 [Colletotrichum paranaense]KAK1462150.1 ADP-ribosylation factor 4 [Colletotrichum melonis]KAK1545728.1 ADP-ribosylation factor 4 [Colletotrichum paranaense]